MKRNKGPSRERGFNFDKVLANCTYKRSTEGCLGVRELLLVMIGHVQQLGLDQFCVRNLEEAAILIQEEMTRRIFISDILQNNHEY